MRANYRKYQGGWIGAAIGAVGGLLAARSARRSASRQAAQNEAMQREFAQQGVQWRVEDAKKAGVHPLYALGGSGAAFSPNPITVDDGGFGAVGQALGGAIERNAQKAEKDLNRRLVEAQIRRADAGSTQDLAQAQYWQSEAARRRGEQNPGFGSGAIIPGTSLGMSDVLGNVHLKVPEQLVPTREDRSRTGATQPGVEAIQFPDFRFDGAAPIQMDERLGEVGQALLLPYLLGNSIRKPLADYFEQIWPIRSMVGDRILGKKDFEDADYERWKKYGVSPRGWEFNREFFNRRR